MNKLIRIATLSAVLPLAVFTVRAANAGLVDIGSFAPAEGCQYVEVNLTPPLLKFASTFVKEQEPQIAEVIAGLKRVRVNVVGFNDTNEADTTQRVQNVRRELEAKGWTKVVTVQEAGKSEDVAVFAKLNDDESIEGLVVTVIDGAGKQAVVVNVVGSIKPEQLASLGKRLDVPGLGKVVVKTSEKDV